MRPIKFEGEGTEVIYKGEGCFDLPTRRKIVEFNNNPTPRVTACYQLTPDDWETLKNNGGCIFISQIGGWFPTEVGLEPDPKPKETWMTFKAMAERMYAEWEMTKVSRMGESYRLNFFDCQFDLTTDQWNQVIEHYVLIQD